MRKIAKYSLLYSAQRIYALLVGHILSYSSDITLRIKNILFVSKSVKGYKNTVNNF